jgi:HK97 family phage major capsid protein
MERLADYTRTVSSLPKGSAFIRYAAAKAFARKGDLIEASGFARERWGRTNPEIADVLFAEGMGARIDPVLRERMRKAAVAAGTTTDASFASPLAQFDVMAAEFAALLRPMTIAGRMAGMRQVPFDISYPRQSSGVALTWVGEGLAAPATAVAYDSATLGHAKCAGVVAVSSELARLSKPSAETLLRNELLAGAVQFLDAQLIDPAVAAVSNVSPASITSGITPIVSSGSTATELAADFASMIASLADAECLTSPYWIMRNADAGKLACRRDAQGGLAFPSITPKGGTLLGIPVLTSNAVPASVSGGSIIALVDAAQIEYADENLLAVDASNTATLQLVDDPNNTAAAQVSLWQSDLVGFRLTAYRNWRRRRDEAVAVLDQVHL